MINPRGEVLVVNQRGNSWSLPKGHVDPGEDLLTAARREIYEESGVTDLALVGEIGSYQRPRIGKHGGENRGEMKTLHFFLFTTSQMTLAPVDADNPEARWVPPDEVAGLLSHPRDKEFFRQALDTVRALSLKKG